MRVPARPPATADELRGAHASARREVRDGMAMMLYHDALTQDRGMDGECEDMHARWAVQAATRLADALYPKKGTPDG